MFSCIKYKFGGDLNRKHVIKKRNNSGKELLLSKNDEKTKKTHNSERTGGSKNKPHSREIISENVPVTDRRDTDDHIDKDVTVDTDEGWYSRDVSDMSDYLSYQV